MDKRNFYLFLTVLILILAFAKFKVHHVFINDKSERVDQTIMQEIDESLFRNENIVSDESNFTDEQTYITELKSLAGVPDWFDSVKLDYYARPTSYKDVNLRVNQYLRDGVCCDRNDPAVVLKNRQVVLPEPFFRD